MSVMMGARVTVSTYTPAPLAASDQYCANLNGFYDTRRTKVPQNKDINLPWSSANNTFIQSVHSNGMGGTCECSDNRLKKELIQRI